jgi:hypothetical protein
MLNDILTNIEFSTTAVVRYIQPPREVNDVKNANKARTTV